MLPVMKFKLKQLLKERGYTYRAFSSLTGVSTNTLIQMAQNRLDKVGVGNLGRVLDGLKCTPNELIEPDEEGHYGR